ncbi:MAG: flavin reductase family protein [Acidobacteria bacterium]|nr:flavin reductase family protein [Acidobacteriota bacterium]
MPTIDPNSTTPQDLYKLLIGLVVPRPIAFVSSLSADGVPNLAPFSFFTVVSANPPVICFTPMRKGAAAGGGRKDTLANIEATREFTVSIVSESFAQQMNLCSGEYPPEVNEFEVAGLTPLASELVAPARVAESLATMECRLLKVVQVSDKPLGGSLVLGEVLRFHIADALFQNFRIDPGVLQAIGRMGGPAYTRTNDLFEMQRPQV